LAAVSQVERFRAAAGASGRASIASVETEARDSLPRLSGRFYNTKNHAGEAAMTTFEEFGRTVDREFEKLKKFFEEDFKPNARRGAIEALRATAARLSELAADLERAGERSAPPAEK
jgi:hypothetical protein